MKSSSKAFLLSIISLTITGCTDVNFDPLDFSNNRTNMQVVAQTVETVETAVIVDEAALVKPVAESPLVEPTIVEPTPVYVHVVETAPTVILPTYIQPIRETGPQEVVVVAEVGQTTETVVINLPVVVEEIVIIEPEPEVVVVVVEPTPEPIVEHIVIIEPEPEYEPEVDEEVEIDPYGETIFYTQEVSGDWNPNADSWVDSYSVGNQCYFHTTFDHGAGELEVQTPYGTRTVAQVFQLIGEGPGIGDNPRYNDIQCGNGPANDAGDEDQGECPGRVDQGKGGCGVTGPKWYFHGTDNVLRD